jgi:hypothetical protein
MKKLVLGSLALALIATQATGCIIVDDDDDDEELAVITAEWQFLNIASPAPLPCPAGYNTVALHNQEIDGAGNSIGSPIIDLFDCIDGVKASAPLPAAVYDTFLEVTNGSGGLVYAKSLPADVDVRTVDQRFSAKIYNDGGYFAFGWALRGASGAALACEQVAELAAGVGGVEIFSTLAGTQAAVVDQFDCKKGFDFTGALRTGSYNVSINAFRDGNPDTALGPAVSLPTRVIGDRNRVTDLGNVVLTINGR